MGEVGDAYAGVRQRITEMVRAAGDPKSIRVPTCPEWTVHDVVSHVAGVVDDAVNGRLDGVGTDPWTAKQVEARKDRDTESVLLEWEEQAPAFEGILDAIGPPGRQAVFDVVSHEHDVRAALGAQGAHDSDAIAVGLSFAAAGFAEASAVPVAVVTAEGDRWASEGGEPVATLRASRFEVLRALSGRRSEAQIRAMEWDGDVDAVMASFTFGPFSPSPTDVVE